MESVIIVESPSKSHTISSYVGDEFRVVASIGHIRDLATKGKEGLGIDIENNFKPTYVTIKDKTKLVSELKKLCKGKKVYLATDPDREGEAISFHLKEVLNLSEDDYSRIEFHEITKKAVLEAFNHERKIDMDLVNSQETRRIIDRIIGFRLSKLMQSRIKSKSAGRVQSVALKLVVDLEKEIEAFVSTPYYEFDAVKDNLKFNFISYKDNKDRIVSKELALTILNSLSKNFEIINKEEKDVIRQSKPAYTTSTLEQDASNKLNFSSSKTMSVAQKLYEGKNIGSETTGLITYMRTDSTRLADVFVKDAINYINETYGKEYVGSVHNKTQKLAQDAHEAIRVTDISRAPSSVKKYLTNDEYKLYSLIYSRTITSLMSNAKDSRLTYKLKDNDTIWHLVYTTNVFPGFEKGDLFLKKEKTSEIPNFNVGDVINNVEVNINELFTKPKARYTEATLIKDMEDLGIGRPSTYAQTITTLKDRDYVTLDGKSLVPTKQGIITSDVLGEYFSEIINVKYTANMETKLDEIAKGNETELQELTDFYNDFNPLYLNAKEKMEKIGPQLLDELCPECGSPLCIRVNKYKQEFISCSNYPACKYIKKEESKSVDTGIICPVCHTGHIVSRVASKGMNKGKTFYACSNFPKCRTTFSDIPIDKVCPKCGSVMLQHEDGTLYCSKHCDEVQEITLETRLIEYRTKKYKELHVKAYNVLTNSDIENIIHKMPNSLEDLKDGIFKYNSEDKINQFGNDIIQIVNEFRK